MLTDALHLLEQLGVLSAIRAAVLISVAVFIYRKFTG